MYCVRCHLWNDFQHLTLDMHMKILTRQRAALYARQHTPAERRAFVIGNIGNISGSNFDWGVHRGENILRKVLVRWWKEGKVEWKSFLTEIKERKGKT